MCNRCNYDSPDNQIYVDPLTNEYYLDIETSEWDEYDDGFVHQKEYIAYCPWCGRKLGEQIQKKFRIPLVTKENIKARR